MTHNLRLPAIALTLAALGSAGVVFWPGEDAELTTSPAPASNESSEPSPVTSPTTDGSSPRAAEEPVAEAFPPRTWHGEVLDVRGRPLAGVPVGFAGDSEAGFDERTRTDDDGSFSFVAAPVHAELRCGPPWATVRGARLDPETNGGETRRPALLIAHTAVGMAGGLLSPDGTPVTGAMLLPTPVAPDLVDVDPADGLPASAPPVLSDAAGRFALEGLPAGLVEIQIHTPDHAIRHIPAATRDTTDLRIVLADEPDSDRLQYTGRVVDESGAPIAEALLQLGPSLHTRSDSFGHFVLDAPRAEVPLRTTPWLATRPGHLPATAERDAEDLTLRLPARARTIRGHVRTPDGRARPGLLVFPWRTRPVHARIDQHVEDLAAKRSEPILLEGRPRHCIDRSAADGSFALSGLRPGVDYRLRIYDPSTGLAWTSKPRLAGDSTVELVLPDDEDAVQRFAGVVRTRTGRSVARARIELLTDLGHPETGQSPSRLPLGETDLSGRFAIGPLPVSDGRIRIYAPQVADAILDVHDLPRASDDFQVSVARLCTFALDAEPTGDRPGIATMRLWDRDGEPLTMRVTPPGTEAPTDLLELEAARHGTRFLASELAATAVLVDLDGEEHRVPVRPRIGATTTVGR